MDIKTLEHFLDYKVYLDDPQLIVDNLVEKAKTYLPEKQISGIQKAYDYAKKAHDGQFRLSGEPYIIHPLKVAEFLMEIKPDLPTLQACILHDIIEDTPITQEEIAKEFSQEVADLCEGLVKVSKVRYKGEERHLETIKKTFLAMAKDLRVIFIKLCDRIHNIQTLQFHPNPSKIQKIAQETMKIFVPIAKRLGLFYYQTFLENGAFRFLEEEEFERIFSYLKKYFGYGEKYISQGIKVIKHLLEEEGVDDFQVKGRIKSPYRIYEKLEKKYKTEDISEVMDLLAYRILTKSVSDCYIILGIIHKHYTPLIKKIKDYISVPKPNGYQSIHTTILGMFSFPIEVQIRTYEMDGVAEYGVAAHFAYTESGKSVVVNEHQSEWIKKLQEIVSSYTESDDKESFKNDLKIEVLDKRIYLYTPKGDLLELPNGSTVSDFAFAIHTQIGLRFKNAIVNGQIKPITYRPKTGDVININIFKNKFSANKHWFDFLHTMSAKSNLNKFLKVQHKEEIVKKIISDLDEFLVKLHLPKYNSNDDKIKIFFTDNKSELEKKFFEVYDRKMTLGQLIKMVYPKEWKIYNEKIHNQPIQQQVSKPLSAGVIIDGEKLFNYNLCPECGPKIGDKIVAKSSRDGIKVHALDCKSFKTIAFEKLLEAHWEGQDTNHYAVSIELRIFNKYSSLLDVMNVFSDLRIVILEVSVKNNGDGTSTVFLESEFTNPAKISFLLNSLKKFDDSIKVLKKKIS